MAVFETWLKSDLKKPVVVKQLTGVVFSQDSKANKVGVIVTDDGEPVELSGTVYGYVIKPNGTTVEVAGAIEDTNKAYFIMPQEAYAVGHISIVIKLSSTGSVITTLAACTAYVYQSRKGTGVVPTGTVIPDLQALETAISEATSAATAANTAATAANTAAANVTGAIAPLFAEATANDAGTYVTKDGKMYFLPDGHTANATWANTTKTEVTAGGEICDLKSAIDNLKGPDKNLLYYYDWILNGATVSLSGDNIIVEATSAATYRSAIIHVPTNGAQSMVLSYNSKSATVSTQTAASIRYGFVNSNNSETWSGYVSSSPLVINTAGKDAVAIGLYVDQLSVEIGDKATFNKIQLEAGTEATTFSKKPLTAVDDGARKAVEDLDAAIPTKAVNAITEIGLNKFNPNTTEGGYINNDSGNVTSSDTYFTSDFIDVSNFQYGYAFTPKARKLIFYDANKNAIAASYHTNETAAGVITLDSSYKYVRFSWYYTSTNIMVCDASTLPAYQPYEIIAKNGVNYLNNDTKAKIEQMIGGGGSKGIELASFLNGKTIAVFGDSIMHGAGNNDDGIADIFADKYNMTAADYSVSGATMGVRTDDPSYTVDEQHHIAKQVRNAIAASITPDIIIFNGGTNDIGGEIPIGEMSQVYTQPSAENYFANGFETVAYLLMSNFVGVPIIYMRAHNMSSRSYTGQVSYGELGNQIAEKWGIRTVDMYKRMNTQIAAYRTAYLADYTHPNETGYLKYYIPAIEDFIFSELIN